MKETEVFTWDREDLVKTLRSVHNLEEPDQIKLSSSGLKLIYNGGIKNAKRRYNKRTV